MLIEFYLNLLKCLYLSRLINVKLLDASCLLLPEHDYLKNLRN